MPIVRPGDTVVHDLHGSRFTSYTAPSRGSKEMCAWRLDVSPGTQGVPHTVTREEILFVLSGTLNVSLTDAPASPVPDTSTPDTSSPETSTPDTSSPDTSTPDTSTPDTATTQASHPGDAIVVPPGTTLQVSNHGEEPASAWVTTNAGLEAILPDGSRLTPPWTR